MIIFTKHAQDRMKERGILKEDVKKVILNPEKINRENRRVIVSRKVNNKTLEIVYVIEKNNRIILTCYYLS